MTVSRFAFPAVCGTPLAVCGSAGFNTLPAPARVRLLRNGCAIAVAFRTAPDLDKLLAAGAGSVSADGVTWEPCASARDAADRDASTLLFTPPTRIPSGEGWRFGIYADGRRRVWAL